MKNLNDIDVGIKKASIVVEELRLLLEKINRKIHNTE